MLARRQRDIPLRFDDGFRAGIATLVTAPVPIAAIATVAPEAGFTDEVLLIAFVALCAMFSGFSLVYLIWTHRVYARLDRERAARIAAAQHRRGPSRLARLLGFARTEDWAIFAASSALIVAVAATVVGPGNAVWLPVLVLLTAGTAWATMVYAFALRYFRLDAGGERITFDLDEPVEFIDFVSMSVMVSSVGALSAGHPRTRAGLAAVRTHTFIAFAFNALVVAMTVSLVTALITSV